jgi:hypothetical protein
MMTMFSCRAIPSQASFALPPRRGARDLGAPLPFYSARGVPWAFRQGCDRSAYTRILGDPLRCVPRGGGGSLQFFVPLACGPP